jgi:hypothetical protein
MQPIDRAAARPHFRQRQRERSTRVILCLASLFLVAGSLCAQAQPAKSSSTVDSSEIVWRMVAQNETRANQLKHFTSRRHYHLEFHGLGRSMVADMHVQVSYDAGIGKTFHVTDESGSHLLLNHVFKKLLETEEDDSRQKKSALTPFNYNFSFDSEVSEGDRKLYVFSVEPKVKNKLLYRGTIWVDAEDYAVVRVEAEPAENPSFWIKSTRIDHVYSKNGLFWLPQTNRSESKVRFGGTAVLTIDYGIYEFDNPSQSTQMQAPEMAADKPAGEVQ